MFNFMFEEIIAQVGIEATNQLIRKAWDFIKSEPTKEELNEFLNSYIRLNNQTVNADGFIDMLIESGFMDIHGSRIKAKKFLKVGNRNGRFVIDNGVDLSTDKSSIKGGSGTSITGSNASIDMDEDGNINFRVG